MKKFLPLMILAIISAFLIFFRFPDIPKYLAFDEVEFTKLALSLDNKPYIPYSQLATGHSTLYFYILLASLKTFGTNVFALRLPATIFGYLSVIFFFLIVKKLKNYELRVMNFNILPFLLSIILLTSRWFLNFSRFSFEAIFLLFLELTSIYFLLQSNVILSPIDSGRAPSSLARMTHIIFSGLFAGLAFLSYTPGRIFFLLPLLFLTLQTLRTLKLYKLAYFLIPFIIIITPLTNYLVTNKDSRIDKLFFWKNHEMTLSQKIAGTVQNVSSISQMFIIKGDVNGKHNYPGKPALNPILGILFLAGLLISIKNYKNIYNQLFLIYFFLSIFPSLAVYPWENPSMLRTFTVLPSVVYFIGVSINVILGRICYAETTPESPIDSGRAPSSLARMTFVFILILFSSFYELRTYFKYQAPVFEHSFEIRYPLEKAVKMKNVYEKIP